MANQGTVTSGVMLIYIGSGTRADAIPGPVSGNGYAPRVNVEQLVLKQDVEGLLATGQWIKPPKKRYKEVDDASE